MPTGVVPVTAVPTVLRYGSQRDARVLVDSQWRTIRTEELPQYVSEELNSENRKRVEGVEAVLVCCTSLRLVDDIARIEKELGKPVTSSNHAMAWHALRLAGIHDTMPQFGRLFELPL